MTVLSDDAHAGITTFFDRISDVRYLRLLLPLIVQAMWPAEDVVAQAPLTTDDAAVAARRTIHVEFFGQFARLPASARPATAQQTYVLTMGYGAASRLEVGFDFPLIGIRRPGRTSVGTGDLNLTGKLLLNDPADALAPRFALGAAIEFPTGDVSKGFGSGVADYDMNLIAELRPDSAVTVRLNTGVQFAGNTLTGLIGVRDRGVVLSGGASLTHVLSPRVAVAGELTGYQGRSRTAADRELRAQSVVTIMLPDGKALSVTLQRGWYASPSWQVQCGTSLDW